MSTHVSSYKMLKAHPEWKSGIRKLEQSVNGKRYRYVPKGKIANTAVFRNAIHDGDIIAIITNKRVSTQPTSVLLPGTKTDCICSTPAAFYKKVIDEPMTLYTYMHINIRCR